MAAFEAITGSRPWPARYTFSPAVRVGNLLVISGTTATDDSGEVVAPGDIVEQTRVILSKFQRLLETTEYITTTEHYRRTAEVRREFFSAPYPAATGVIVAGLLREGAVIEISAVAVLPS